MLKKGFKTAEDYILDTANTLLLVLLTFLTLYPLLYIISMSISEANAVLSGRVLLWPIGFTLTSYIQVLNYPIFWEAYGNTLWYTVVGSVISVVFTVMCGYAVSRRDFVIKKFVTMVMLITMLFSGGMIPSFITITKLELYNTRWAIVLPVAVNAWNIIIARVFFQQNIPESLEEAAKIDGANDIGILIKIVLPLSSTIIAILALFSAVFHWNSFFPALLYINDESLKPVQLVLREIVIRNTQTGMIGADETMIAQRMLYMVQIKYVCIIISILPIMMLYPFLQKYFVKGIMIGAIKE